MVWTLEEDDAKQVILNNNVKQQVASSTSRDPLHIPSSSVTKARAKRIKEALIGLVWETLAKQMAIGLTNLDKNAKGVIELTVIFLA